MWIITHDNVHEAGRNPAVNVPKSRDYLEKATRKKAEQRKRHFRLMKQDRELFRGVAYFENDASFKEILRPLDEFGRAMYDCDAIEYMVDRSDRYRGVETLVAIGAVALWNRVPEDLGREFDAWADYDQQVYRTLLEIHHIDSVTELTQDMLGQALKHCM